MPAQTIRYFSSRREIWRWYWRAWAKPKGLWRYHAYIAVLLAALRAEVQGLSHFRPTVFLAPTFAAMLGCMLFFSLWSQLRFKSAERTLSVSPTGWSTQIGNLSAARSWSEVREITEDGDTIVVERDNQNALTFPHGLLWTRRSAHVF
jgi:hypothetical protein